jgi:hypothetical protein
MGSGLGRSEEDWKRFTSWLMHGNNTRKLPVQLSLLKLAKPPCFSIFYGFFLQNRTRRRQNSFPMGGKGVGTSGSGEVVGKGVGR